jgi:division protein CdvB (Snf7/Vps24/ESCRT-III family)
MDVIMSFVARWEKKGDPSTYDKLVETIRPTDPLKAKLETSIRRLEVEIQRLDQTHDRLQKQDKALFDKAVECQRMHDNKRAIVYANEVANIRKIEQMILQTKLALEVVASRGRTSTELGDIAITLIPTIETMNGLKNGIATVTPQAENQLSEIGSLLSGFTVDTGMMTNPITFESPDEDASRILGEAQYIAESKMKDGFPDLPGQKSSQLIGKDDSPH